jgi:hypothetical protein
VQCFSTDNYVTNDSVNDSLPISVNGCTVISDDDVDFGNVQTFEIANDSAIGLM